MAKKGDCGGCVNADGSPRREARKGSATCAECATELREVNAGRMACPRYTGPTMAEAERMFAKLQALQALPPKGWL